MPRDRRVSAATLLRDFVIVACAISAGIHAALTPEHFREGAGAGGGFLAATALSAAFALALTRRPTPAVTAAAALTFAGLIGSYALAVTTGVPLLHPEVEAVDGLALVTKAIEAAGLIAALLLLRDPSRTYPLHSLRPKGTLT
jgi:hypothetical protein